MSDNSMGFRTKYTYQPDYSEFFDPTTMQGMGNWFEDALSKAWEDNKDNIENKASQEFKDAVDKYGQPLLDDIYKEAIVTADKYLTADEEQFERSKKNFQKFAQVGTATAFESLKQTIIANKWPIIGGTIGAMFLFGMVGYGFANYATKRS